MSLASPYIESYYVADGVTTSFAFGQGFTALSQENVKCIIYFEDGTSCIPVFTVNMVTGYINIVTLTKPDGTVLTAPPTGSVVRVFRDTPEQQNVTASQLQNYTAKQLERIFDSIVAMIQELSFLANRKTIRLTETQRDVSVEQLTEAKDQGVIYWDFDSRKLKATDYGQDEIVKSETVDRLVYLQAENKIYFIPKGTTTQIPIGSASIHNNLGGRNAPDCHPESAITNLTTHLQELRDAGANVDLKAEEALSKAQEAVNVSEEAKNTSDYAKEKANEAKSIADYASDKADSAIEYAQAAQDDIANIYSDRYTFTIEAGQTTLQFEENIEDKIIDLYLNGQLITQTGNWTVENNTITLLFEPEAGDIIFVMVGAIGHAVNIVSLDSHNINPNAHSNIVATINNRINTVDARIDTANIDCGLLS